MAKVNMESKVNVGADVLWNTIGGFNALPAWHPAVQSSESTGDNAGSTRTLNLVGGGQIVERLETVSKDEKRYRYSIVSSPLPVLNYEAELQVKDNGDGTSTVAWSSNFQPAGTTENDAVKAIQGVYQAGLDNLRKMFGG
jgi:mxaD protein